MLVGGSGSSALIGERRVASVLAAFVCAFLIIPPKGISHLRIENPRTNTFAILSHSRKVRTHLLPRPAYRRDVVLRAEGASHRDILGADVPPLLRRRGGLAVRGLVHGSGRGQGGQVGRVGGGDTATPACRRRA